MNLGNPGVFGGPGDKCDWSIIRTMRSAGYSINRYYALAVRPIFQEIYKDWKRSKGDTCLLRLLGKRCRYPYGPRFGQEHDHSLPGADHTILARKPGGALRYMTQPYQMEWEDIQKAVAMCQRLGLRMDICANSWYYPGRTLLVQVRKADAPDEYPRAIETEQYL